MEKIIQLSTNNENDAYKVLETLKELNDKEDLNLSEYVIIKKEEDGKIALKEDASNSLGGTLVGGTAGALLGALFGPYGFLLGGTFGSLAGLTADTMNSMSTDELLEKVSANLPNGKVVVVAHIFEQWETPLDSSIGDLAEITRVDVDEELSKAIEADLDAMDKEIEEAKENVKKAVGNAKQNAQAKLDELRDKRDKKQKQYRDKMKAQKNTLKTWLAKTQEKIKSNFDKN
ncbi:DUF1269 domain-containing protein [Muricauda sp. 334s03]|uniref:DUF1269 domain-containing protein n=2 Tax=Flagellimonas TaxID=444459 RepID=A0ABT5XNK2_9FLAO|nr:MULTISPECIES: DUF1269 domain-containing protein [Allomuricauda]MDF0707462.1 DUF1269 domain-containing protein [[Muricauda] okinawensis]MDF0715363.1 DUF1269 domain-containing protein [[Muricauda] yonaguniensis]